MCLILQIQKIFLGLHLNAKSNIYESKAETHCQNGEKLLDRQVGPQPLFKHADGLMLQVVIGGNATISQRLNGPIILQH